MKTKKIVTVAALALGAWLLLRNRNNITITKWWQNRDNWQKIDPNNFEINPVDPEIGEKNVDDFNPIVRK